ncbi:Benzoyl-CoA reductase/2-hydroxyglutaryl-CoA dehydratase subunit, BcrC/BadD/HgdB [Lachnospiraceae bacterium KHCPX20]|nr:Benzoyl-CoA reductase/2-hydroxyglutaryl-CoA dehydratase subunit, BcrC/BadD/HgdB [Lachnospiraceae bacterium KHCPX20]
MAQTIVRIQTRLMKGYYKNFSKYSKGRLPEQKVAWVTAFTPVEILEALGILYYYPESYAAVIAASEKEQAYISISEEQNLSRDCCSYSCCFNGCLDLEEGPRGVPPRPDVLIATNNQCNTLPGWWNLLSQKYHIPLIVIDYPGETDDRESAFEYVLNQHKSLISKMEDLSGNKLDETVLEKIIENSRKSVAAWENVISYLPQKDINITALFDDMNFLITARCKEDTSEMYRMMAEAMNEKADKDKSRIPIYWLGYPLWYHADRYLSELLNDFSIVGANYVTWWNLNYEGKDSFESLFSAYNYTFLNLSQESRDLRLAKIIKASGAKAAIVLHNKSCKCDFVSARNIDLPQAELEIDMIDRHYLNMERAKKQIDLLKETVCTA